jgi:hypothetical protein
MAAAGLLAALVIPYEWVLQDKCCGSKAACHFLFASAIKSTGSAFMAAA